MNNRPVEKKSSRTRLEGSDSPERGSFLLSETSVSPATRWVGLSVAFFFPFVLTFVYFIYGKGNPSIQSSAYGIGKGIQFAMPVFLTAFLFRESIRPRGWTWRGLGVGLAFGLTIFLAILFLWDSLAASESFRGAVEGIRGNLGDRLELLGLGRPIPYLVLAAFYSAIHSGLEEYYWRWFVFGNLNRFFPLQAAVILGAVGFSLHHLLVVGDYFGYRSPLTWLAILGVFSGGVFWSLLYRKSGSIYAVWLSHGIIDAAIFAVGWKILF